ncbi:hypothetical protein DSC45_34495 [Streptomyces sp. YIM 130001]|uniref:DUF2306 domain-containing protein n=1 Tax=Streptomyces sp. YIM 130001 TaxID=2259644 RepID=UPI000E649B71|nr:DUF2306 domain-containing protein [Streptomyces sp. YIM 130001]RII07938.1 hypothetical protein DSC45_34495 [Streptomyces sp. YIM 130001]
MAQNAEIGEFTGADTPPRQAAPQPWIEEPTTARSWLTRPWMLPLALLVAFFLLISWPRYLGIAPEQSLIPINPDFAAHYTVLWLHVAFGTVAIVTAVLQVWPWLRRRHPAVHRVSGRAYVFAGILPAALLSLVIMPFGTLQGAGAVGTTLWAGLSLATTIAGFRAARQGRFADHRRHMLYSFALTMSVMTGRVLFNVAWYGAPQLPGFSESQLPLVSQLAGFWLNWILTLGVTYLWLRRKNRTSMEGQQL